MNELEKLQTQTMIELHKEQFKKTLDIYYLTAANIDKLIITMLFAEIGFLTHYLTIIEHIQLWYGIPILSGTIGIVIALISYNLSKKLLSYEEQRLELKISQFIALLSPDSDTKEESIIELSTKTDTLVNKLSVLVYVFLAVTTLSSIITIYISKIYS